MLQLIKSCFQLVYVLCLFVWFIHISFPCQASSLPVYLPSHACDYLSFPNLLHLRPIVSLSLLCIYTSLLPSWFPPDCRVPHSSILQITQGFVWLIVKPLDRFLTLPPCLILLVTVAWLKPLLLPSSCALPGQTTDSASMCDPLWFCLLTEDLAFWLCLLVYPPLICLFI